MRPRERAIVLRRRAGLLSVDDLADRCELHPDLVRRLVALGLIEPAERGDEEAGGGGPPDAPADAPTEAFEPSTVVRVLRIVRLRRELGVNFAGVGLVLDLLDRIEILEARLRRFEG